MVFVCGYEVAQNSATAEECDRIRSNLACVQDPCCRPCPPLEEHKLPAAGMPTSSGETVAETLNWKKPVCVNPCDSVPRECAAIAACPPPPPKVVLGPCPQQQQQQQPMNAAPVFKVDPCRTNCPYLAGACPQPEIRLQQWRQDGVLGSVGGGGTPRHLLQQQLQQQRESVPIRREDGILGYVGGPQTMASVVVVPVGATRAERPSAPLPPPVKLMPVSIPARTEVAPARSKYDCDSKTAPKCENNCPECPIEIHNRTVYPKCEAMVPGYGGHVPGITTCKFGKTFGRETREALQKVYSTPRLRTYPKKC